MEDYGWLGTGILTLELRRFCPHVQENLVQSKRNTQECHLYQ